jgi:ABC-type transport system involved in multi-copper enzyme maturation permease subunit
MSVPTLLAADPASLGSGKVTQLGVIRSEWIKLRTLRSTWYSLLVTVVFVVGLGVLFSALRAHRFNQDRAQGAIGPGPRFGDFLDPTLVSLRGVFLAQLAIGVLGVLVITGEYSTGMIRSSIAAVPHRRPVLIAKALVFGVTALILTEIAAFAAFLLGQLALKSTHFQADLGTHDALRAVIGAGLYLTLIGLLAIGLGFMIRNTAGAIAAVFGIVLVLPLLANALPTPYSTDVSKYLPLNAGTQILMTLNPDHSQLSPWAGIGITALYALAALIAGAIVLTRRDA